MHEVPLYAKSTASPNEPLPVQDVDTETTRATETGPEAAERGQDPVQELKVWRDRALRLQAEMENYCKRQRRLAEEQVAASRQQALGALLEVADNLSRALDVAGPSSTQVDAASLLEGVEITLQGVRQALDRQGVHSIQAKGRPFDPAWHEAVATVPHQAANVTPNTVVKVLEKGYRLGERILRPARVVVAV